MKKILFSLALALSFVLTSCTTEDISSNDVSATGVTSITVQLQSSDAATRTVSNPDLEDLRLFMMLSYDGVIVDSYENSAWDGAATSWELKLANDIQDYHISAWADYGDGYYSVTSEVGSAPAVAISGALIGNDNECDAYFAQQSLSGASTVSLTLQRPLAMVQIAATDCDEPSVYNAGFVPTSYDLSLNAPTSLDLLTGDVADYEDLSVAGVSTGLTANEAQSSNCVLSYVYILADADDTTIADKVSTTLYSGSTALASYDFENIPVQRNYVTKIYGDLITSNGTITVEVDPIWNGYITDLIQTTIDLSGYGTYKIIITEADVTAMYSDVTPANLIYTFVGGSSDATVEFEFESAAVAAAVATVVADFSADNDGTNIKFTSDSYTGMFEITNYYENGNTTALGDLYFDAPNASGLLDSGFTVNNLYVNTAPSTFTVADGAAVLGDTYVTGGRLIINGESEGTIYVENATVLVANGNGYDYYASTGVNALYYTESVGFDASIDSIVDLFDTSISLDDYFDIALSMQYAGVVGLFDFNNDDDGYNANNWRNIALSVTSQGREAGTATLKEDFDLDVTTASDAADLLNAAIDELAEALDGEVDKMLEAFAAMESRMPAEVYSIFYSKIAELQETVTVFTESIPEVTIPSGDGIPVGTIIPDEDNLGFDDVFAIIGTPEDEFDITKIADYLSGDEPITLYMIVNLVNQINEADEDVATIQAEIDVLEAEYASLVAANEALTEAISEITSTDETLLSLEAQFNDAVDYYNSLEEPASSGMLWYIYAATLNSDFTLGSSECYYSNLYTSYIIYGSISSTNLALMNAKNAQLLVIDGIASAYYDALINAGGGDLTTSIAANTARMEEIGTQTDLSLLEALGWDLSDLTDADTINAILSFLGYDFTLSEDTNLDITEYLYSGELGDLYIDLFEATLYSTVFDTALEELGVSEDVLSIISLAAEYLETVCDVLYELETVGAAIDDFNPWTYTYTGEASFADGIDGAKVTLEFEYAAGRSIFVTNETSALLTY